MRPSRWLLACGVAVPFLYFATLGLGGWLTDGYSHVSQYASELGITGSPAAGLFNGGIVLTGLATLLGAIGLFVATRDAGAGRPWPPLAALCTGLFGVGLVFGGVFPMPDPRHGGFGLGMAVHLAPFFLALALRGDPGRKGLRRYLVVNGVLMLLLLAPMMGVGGLVTRANVGAFQRAYALAMFSWIGVASWALLRSSTPRRGAPD